MASSGKYSKYHSERPCTNCYLCGKSNLQYSHYGAWGENEKDFLKQHWDDEPAPSACICIAHHKEAKRSHHPGYIPKWSKKSRNVDNNKSCVYPFCEAKEKLIKPSFAPMEEIKSKVQFEIPDMIPYYAMNIIKRYM